MRIFRVKAMFFPSDVRRVLAVPAYEAYVRGRGSGCGPARLLLSLTFSLLSHSLTVSLSNDLAPLGPWRMRSVRAALARRGSDLGLRSPSSLWFSTLTHVRVAQKAKFKLIII